MKPTALILVFLVPSMALARDPGFVVVEEGRPTATIVIATDAPENARLAAAELRHYVREMSGAELAVTNDSATPPGSLILVGRSKLTEGLRQIPTGLTSRYREEGYVISAQGDLLLLAGNDTGPYLGTRYAVVECLHRLGVRWFMPGKFGESVPRKSTLSLDPIDALRTPDFPMRNYWQHHKDNMSKEDAEWKIHQRMNPRMHEWVGIPSDSSIRDYLPNDQFKTHPEWFAQRRDGTRDPHMVCMTSTGMVAHFVARVKANARAGKRYSAFAPDDGMPRCFCDRCQRLANGFDGFGTNDRDPLPEASTSNEWFHFVDAILDAVNEEFPEHKIVTNGYANRDIPPELPEFNTRSNLVVMFANINACTLHGYDDAHCWQMKRQGEMVRGWAGLSDKVYLYQYNYTMLVSKFTVTPMVHRVRQNIPRLKQWGVLGFHDQDESDWALSGLPTRLVRAALEWDTNADIDVLLDDFYARWFGAAASPMKAYYDALEDAFARTTAHGHEDVVLNQIYTPDLMRKLRKHVESAERRADTELDRAHVAVERRMFDHLSDYVAMETAKRECRFAEGALHADRLLDHQAALHRVSPFFGYEPYAVYGPDWEAKRLRDLASRTQGTNGSLVVILPEQARGRKDPFDDGRYEGWQAAEYDDSGWKSLLTTAGWEAQGHQDRQGHAYRGVMWYRLNVEVPAESAGKRLRLVAPSVVNEAWVWVNGQYVGHRRYEMPWYRPHSLEMDITPLVRAGQPNQITLRVLNNLDVFGASGIYERMFIYAPVKP